MKYKVNGRWVSEGEFRAGIDPSRLREMLESRQPPASMTDREFLEGRGGCYEQFDGNEFVGEFHRRAARAAGVDTSGKVYLSGLAAYPGDPLAWVSGRGDVRRVCEARGWACRGAVDVAAREVEPAGAAVAEDIVAGEVAARLASPEYEGARPADVREEVVAEKKPHWAKGAE